MYLLSVEIICEFQRLWITSLVNAIIPFRSKYMWHNILKSNIQLKIHGRVNTPFY